MDHFGIAFNEIEYSTVVIIRYHKSLIAFICKKCGILIKGDALFVAFPEVFLNVLGRSHSTGCTAVFLGVDYACTLMIFRDILRQTCHYSAQHKAITVFCHVCKRIIGITEVKSACIAIIEALTLCILFKFWRIYKVKLGVLLCKSLGTFIRLYVPLLNGENICRILIGHKLFLYSAYAVTVFQCIIEKLALIAADRL